MTTRRHFLHASAAVLAALKQSDAHFARLCEEYHAVNRAIHRAAQR